MPSWGPGRTCAGHVQGVQVCSVVAIAADAVGGPFRSGPAIDGTVGTGLVPLVGLEGSRWAAWKRRQGESLGKRDGDSERPQRLEGSCSIMEGPHSVPDEKPHLLSSCGGWGGPPGPNVAVLAVPRRFQATWFFLSLKLSVSSAGALSIHSFPTPDWLYHSFWEQSQVSLKPLKRSVAVPRTWSCLLMAGWALVLVTRFLGSR